MFSKKNEDEIEIKETVARDIKDSENNTETAVEVDTPENADDIVASGEKLSQPQKINIKFFFEQKIITIPILAIIFAGVFSSIVWAISAKSPAVADFFANTISFALRFTLTKITYLIPFSLAELILYLLIPAIAFTITLYICKISASKGKKIIAALRGLLRLTSFVCLILFIFNFTFSICYSATPINKKIGFERRLINTEDLANATSKLIELANTAAHNVAYIYAETGSTAMPYSLAELSEKLNDAYSKMLSNHNITKQITARVKPVILSEQMSKMHITGIYSPFTGEANVNIDFPDYTLPFTAAHEMAHLMGIAREDEANFTAFLVCLYSDDNYIRYSGMVNMIEYLRGPLFKSDEELYSKLMATLDTTIWKEMYAYSIFFDEYSDTQISKVASAVNDTYLKAQNQEAGEKSYGLVVDLAVIYMLEIYD